MCRYSLVLFVLVLFVSCSSTNTSIDSDYADKYFANQILTILPLHVDSLISSDITGFSQSFDINSSNAKSFMCDTLNNTIKIYAPRYSKKITIKSIPDNSNWFKSFDIASNFMFVKKKLDNNETIKFKIPKKSFLDSIGIKSDFVLSFNKVIIGGYSPNYITTPVTTSGVTMGITSSISGEFKATSEFIIWDYSLNKPMKFGIQSSSIELSSLSNSDNNSEKWKSIFRMIAKDLFNDTPFDAGF